MRKMWLLMVLCVVIISNVISDVPLPLLEEKVTYSNKGSRSEASHHYLVVNDEAIPDTFWLVWQEGRLYRFHTRQHMWGTDGYVLTNEEKYSVKKSKKVVSDTDLQRKWYVGKEWLQNTPDHWVYVEWLDGAAVVDPIALSALAKELKLPVISRGSKEEIFKMDDK